MLGWGIEGLYVLVNWSISLFLYYTHSHAHGFFFTSQKHAHSSFFSRCTPYKHITLQKITHSYFSLRATKYKHTKNTNHHTCKRKHRTHPVLISLWWQSSSWFWFHNEPTTWLPAVGAGYHWVLISSYAAIYCYCGKELLGNPHCATDVTFLNE